MDVTERIDALLHQKKLSRRRIAIIAGLAPSTLQSAMERKGSMTINMIEKVADALDVSPAYLCGWIEKEEPQR